MLKNLYSHSLKARVTNHNLLIFFMSFTIAVSSGCGRRPKQLLGGGISRKKSKDNHLLLDPITKLSIIKTDNNELLLSWQKYENKPCSEFIGYNIYRFISGSFVPGHPLNKRPIRQTTYRDIRCKQDKIWCYLVRGVIIKNNQVIETPASKVVHYEY